MMEQHEFENLYCKYRDNTRKLDLLLQALWRFLLRFDVVHISACKNEMKRSNLSCERVDESPRTQLPDFSRDNAKKNPRGSSEPASGASSAMDKNIKKA